MGRFVTGVTVVTTLDDANGTQAPQPFGTTVNSFTSVSLDPPLVLITIGRERSIHPVLARTCRFAVNILAEGAQELSDCFAGAPSPIPRSDFCGASWQPSANGMPFLDAALAWVDCELERVIEAGDHTIYLGRVAGLETVRLQRLAVALLPAPLPAHRARRGRRPARQAGQDVGPRVPTIAANGLDIHYTVEGEGPPLLLLHGATSSALEDWSAQRPLFRQHFTLYLIDARGHAGTKTHGPDPMAGWSRDALVATWAPSRTPWAWSASTWRASRWAR